jgi:hypothetical protein
VFKDSLNYITGGLSKMFDTFSLDNSGVMRKPAFPHGWNRTENIGHVRHGLPPLKCYPTDRMKEGELAEFIAYYRAHQNDDFDLTASLLEYCVNDVQLLR